MTSPREVLKLVIKNNARASEKEWSDLAYEQLSKGPHARTIFEYWFANNLRSFEVELAADTTVVRDRIGVIREIKSRAKRMRAKLQEALMDHMLSNGLLLREATFGDCAREAGWLGDVAKRGNAHEVVGKTLTEKDLHNIYQRNSAAA